MIKWRELRGITIALLFLISVVLPCGGFAETPKNEIMERKCEAAKEGKEIDEHVKKDCATYFEQTGENAVIGVAASAAAHSVSSGERFRSIAGLALGVSVIGAVIAAGAGGGSALVVIP